MIRLLRLLLISLLFGACANPVSPPGGAKDTEPPKIVLQQPASGSSGYKGDRLELVFDEYINFQGGSEKVLITPSMDPPPKFTLKGKKLIINLPDNLDPELTYTVNLVNAVSDYTENNPLKLIQYVFTQGEAIDSGSIAGTIVNSYDRQRVANVFVGLFEPSDTSEFRKTKPVYIAQSNDQGEFKVDYVKPGDYKLVALEDKNFNFSLEPGSERISLTSNPIYIEKGSVLEQELPVFRVKTSPQIMDHKVLTNSSLYLCFESEMEGITVDVKQYDGADQFYLNPGNDTLFYYWSTPELEQLDFVIRFSDGTVDSLTVPLLKKDINEKFRVKGPHYLNQAIQLNTNEYITGVDTSLLHLTDTLNNNLAYELSWDRDRLFLVPLTNAIRTLRIQIEPEAVTFIQGNKNNKSMLFDLTLNEAETKSNLFLSFNKALPEQAIFELYTSGGNRMTKLDVGSEQKVNVKELSAGTYTIRIYQDINDNDVWDTGDVINQTPPEPTLIYKKDVEIKDNWDKDLQLSF